jgi:DNA-binding transcriptional ArsR family regulator
MTVSGASAEAESPDTAAASAVFGALADPTRRDVLNALAEGGTLSATQLATRLPISRQGILKHLAVLGEAGLVETTKVGREVRYAVVAEPLREASAWLARAATQWDRRLLAIKAAAERAPLS